MLRIQVVDNLHMEWHGVQGPGFIRTGDEPEMIDKLAEAVSNFLPFAKTLL